MISTRRTPVKKRIFLVLTLLALLALAVFVLPAAQKKEKNSKFGMLTMLNMDEEEMTRYVSDNEQALYRLLSGWDQGRGRYRQSGSACRFGQDRVL